MRKKKLKRSKNPRFYM
jgi:hypothetical protein